MVPVGEEIQNALNSAGYNVGTVDGLAGNKTYYALIEFQKDNNLTADGIAGPATREKMFGNPSDGGTDAFPLSEGSSGPYVTAVQYGVYICCYNPYGIDGVDGAGTADAVRRFQLDNNLDGDGVVGAATWEKLKTKIAPIQKALSNHGYDTGGTDGIPGAKTYDAVIAFQKDSGLTPDGMVGNGTLKALGIIEENKYGTNSSEISLNSSGSLIKYLQRMLIQLGYSVPVTGFFDNHTMSVVKTFQSKNGLTPDGIFGKATWKAMFEKYHVPANGSGAQKMVNVAKYELGIGFKEDFSNNITPYGEWYGMNNNPWCAMFVSWCAYQAGILNDKVPKFAYCPTGVSIYRQKQKFFRANIEYKVRQGDTIFFCNPNTNEINHTGIVIGGDERTITTMLIAFLSVLEFLMLI